MTALSLLVKSVLELPSSGDEIPTTTLTPDGDCSRLSDECVGTEEAETETVTPPTLSREIWLTSATAVLTLSRNAWVFDWSKLMPCSPNLSDARTAVGVVVGRAVGMAVGLTEGRVVGCGVALTEGGKVGRAEG